MRELKLSIKTEYLSINERISPVHLFFAQILRDVFVHIYEILRKVLT